MTLALNLIEILLLLGVLAGIVALFVHQRRGYAQVYATQALQRSLYQQLLGHVWSTAALHRTVIEGSVPLPAGSSFALSTELLVYLVRKVLHDKPRCVVELGSGMSTVMLAGALKTTGGHLYSVEHDAGYLDETRAMLRDAGLEAQVTLIHAPLEAFDASHVWYARGPLEALADIDLLLVDGPPGATCAQARYPALPFFATRLAAGAVVLLDDAGRDDEQATLSRWVQAYPELTTESLAFPHAPVVLALPAGQRLAAAGTRAGVSMAG